MNRPEALVVDVTSDGCGGDCDGNETDQHEVARPARAGSEVGEKKAANAELVLGRETSKVVPMGDGVDGGEEDDGVGDELVEGDGPIELDDAMQRGLTE